MPAHQYLYVMKGLSKAYPGGKKVLDNIWLSFLPGAKIGVLGVNGAGKSTLMRIMAGLDNDFTGEAWASEGASVGYLPQEPQLNPNYNDLVPGTGALKSQAYGIAIAKEGVFGDDALGIAVSRPVQVYSGGSVFNSAIDGNRLVFGKRRSDFTTSSTPESDIELGYVTSFLDGALALQANAAYQVNAHGESGKDAVSVLSRAKINF